MGDYTRAMIELFGPKTDIETVLADFPHFDRYDDEPAAGIRYVAEALADQGERELLFALREHGISYWLFLEGDFEYEPQLQLFNPVLGEWSGPSTALGEPLVGSRVIDRIVGEMSEHSTAWLRAELVFASARPWRQFFSHLRDEFFTCLRAEMKAL